MFSRTLLFLVPVLAFVLPTVRAGEPKYLSHGEVDAIAILPAPPTAGGPEAAADLETTYRVYHAGTDEERAKGLDEVKLTIFHFAPAIGPWFQRGRFPKTEALFREVEAETKAVTNAGKKHWQRLRPYHADPARFPNAIEREPSTDYSYPSGHSTRGTVYSLLLAELFPEKREALVAKGRETGWLRVIGGVHYPTDIYAGRVLGQALAAAFLKNEAFQHDLAAARAELAAAEKP